MLTYNYSDEMIKKLSDHAASLPPSPRENYVLVHPHVQVPHGYLPIKIVQHAIRDPMLTHPHHWSIFIPTSPTPGVGNHYQVVGESPVYFTESVFNDYNEVYSYWRGSHTIGYVAPTMLPVLEAQFACVEVEDPWKGDWNNQIWVYDALQGLDHPQMATVELTFDQMMMQMAVVDAAWTVGQAD